MLKYRGQFRVLYETDTRTGQAAEFTFIPCRIRPGANIYRYSDSLLAAYIPGIKTANRLLREHPDIFRAFQTGDSEAVLLFKEADIEKAAIILKAKIQGKNKSPRPKRKLNLSNEQRRVLSERMAEVRKHNNYQSKNALEKKKPFLYKSNEIIPLYVLGGILCTFLMQS